MSLQSPPRRAAYAAITAACVLWGTSFIFGKVALRELRPAQVVLGRFLLASLVLLPFAGVRPVAPRNLLLFALSGALMVPCSFLLQFEGLERTSATSAALIVGALPPILAVAAYFTDGERPGRAGWGAAAASTVGVGILVGFPEQGERALVGDLLVFASIVTTSAWILVTRRLLRRHSPILVTAWSAVVGAFLLLVVMVGRGDAIVPAEAQNLSAATWGALLALGVLCTAVAFSLWTWGLRFVPSSKAGAFINLEPLVGAGLGIALLGEAAGISTAAGGLLVLGAAWVVSQT